MVALKTMLTLSVCRAIRVHVLLEQPTGNLRLGEAGKVMAVTMAMSTPDLMRT